MTKQLIVADINGSIANASIEDIVASGKNKFKNWICKTGLQSLYIDFDGNVWVGNCASGPGKFILAAGKNAWGHLGNIDNGFQLPKSNVVCPYDGCGCGSDIVVSKFKSIPIIQDSEFDAEFESLTELIEVKMLENVPKQILWDVGRRCNYNCSYCWPNVHNTTDPHRPLSDFVKTADYLIEQWSEGNPIHWYFGGGEPTLNPDFELFIEHLRSRNQWAMLVTNASQGPSYWAKNADNYNVLIFSAHFEFMKPELFIRNFKTVIEVLAVKSERLDRFIIKLMTPTGQVERSINFVEALKASSPLYEVVKDKIQFDMVPLRGKQGYDLKDYDESEIKTIIQFNK